MRATDFISTTVTNVNTAKALAQELAAVVAELGDLLAAGQVTQRMRDLRGQIQDLDQQITDLGFHYVGPPRLIEPRNLSEKKDACYHKVRSRYKVWPSAYASGALVQCRKKGAANWGSKSK